MRGGVTAAVVLVFLLVTVPPAGAGSRGTAAVAESMIVSASPDAVRAHPVRLALTLRYEMQCGYPGAGPVLVTFPSALRLPKRFAAGAVRLAGKTTAAKVRGRQVTVTVPPPNGVLCGMVGPGSVKLVFTRKAKLANPRRTGSYLFTARHGNRAFTATLSIKSAS